MARSTPSSASGRRSLLGAVRSIPGNLGESNSAASGAYKSMFGAEPDSIPTAAPLKRAGYLDRIASAVGDLAHGYWPGQRPHR